MAREVHLNVAGGSSLTGPWPRHEGRLGRLVLSELVAGTVRTPTALASGIRFEAPGAGKPRRNGAATGVSSRLRNCGAGTAERVADATQKPSLRSWIARGDVQGHVARRVYKI